MVLINLPETEQIAICASIESEIADLEDADKKEFLSDMGMEEPGLDRLIRAAYKLLGLQTYFTAGVKEVRAWTIIQQVRNGILLRIGNDKFNFCFTLII